MKTRDLHVESIRPLLPPAILLEELPLSEKGSLVVGRTRKEVTRVLRGEDDRLLVIVGPCSIHDPVAGLDYARRPIRTASWASRSRVWRASFRPAATLTATSSCAAASTGRTTTRSACRRRSPRSATPGFPHGS